jgi:hypothetical protein
MPVRRPHEDELEERLSEQPQRILRGLYRPLLGDAEGVEPARPLLGDAEGVEPARPLLGDAEGVEPASDEEISALTGIPRETVTIELYHLVRSLGLHEMPHLEGRAELALLAVRSGLVANG